ncbi:hypothetical protein LTR17_012521 [Elasticomyces elasticus]|nr:hypothetical protein LTR17_012521 [Elasticomyces elasticus]
MATQYKKIAVAGAVGNLGPTVVRELVAAGFDVTILSRSGNTLPNTKSATVDYSSKESLVAALKGQDALVSNLPNHGDQPALIDAAIEAGVKHYIPSEFGSNTSGNSRVAALPVFAGKIATQEYLKQQSKINWTVIVNGFFFDWAISKGMVVNLDGGTTKLYGDPDAKHSLSLISDIGKAVVGVLQHPEEAKNRTVYIQSAALSQNQILNVVKKHKAGGDVERIDTDELLQEGYSLLKKGGADIGTAMFDFILVSIFDKEYGNNWSEKNDNELLGIQELTADEVEKQIVSVFWVTVVAPGGLSHLLAPVHEPELLNMDARASQAALAQLKSGIEMLENNLKIVLNEMQSAQDDLVTLGNTLCKSRKTFEGRRDNHRALTSPDFDVDTDTVIDEECRDSIKRLRDICKPEDFATALKQLHTETGALVRQEEIDLAVFEERYVEQAKKQVAILLKVSTAQEMVDRGKELLSGQPATYQTNIPGDEPLPQTWRS